MKEIRRRALQIVVGLGCLALSFSALASCTGNNARHEVAIGEVVVDATLPIGSRISWESYQTINNTGQANCTPTNGYRFIYSGIGSTAGDGIYATNIPGIGFKLWRHFWFPHETIATSDPNGTGLPVAVQVELVKTGPIANGGILAGQIGLITQNGNHYRSFHWAAGSSVRVVNTTCKFTVNGGRDVDLGGHDASIFNRINATSPPVTLNIASEGCTADAHSVHMSWKGVVDPNNNRAFKITTGPLQGVAVWIERVSNGRTVVPNGQPHTFDALAQGQNYEYRARFTQTEDIVTPGTGSAAVTIDITYN